MKEEKELTIKATITTTETIKQKAREVSKELMGTENISGAFNMLINREHKKLKL